MSFPLPVPFTTVFNHSLAALSLLALFHCDILRVNLGYSFSGDPPLCGLFIFATQLDVKTGTYPFTHHVGKPVFHPFLLISGSRDGTEVRALALRQYCLGLCGLSLFLAFVLTSRGVSVGTLVFSYPQNPTCQNSNSIRDSVVEAPLYECANANSHFVFPASQRLPSLPPPHDRVTEQMFDNCFK